MDETVKKLRMLTACCLSVGLPWLAYESWIYLAPARRHRPFYIVVEGVGLAVWLGLIFVPMALYALGRAKFKRVWMFFLIPIQLPLYTEVFEQPTGSPRFVLGLGTVFVLLLAAGLGWRLDRRLARSGMSQAVAN